MATYAEMSLEQLQEIYNEYVDLLHTGGKAYQAIPEGAFENLEDWMALKREEEEKRNQEIGK